MILGVMYLFLGLMLNAKDFIYLPGLQEVYTWGENSNFTLGHETGTRRKHPEMVDAFGKRGESIKQVKFVNPLCI